MRQPPSLRLHMEEEEVVPETLSLNEEETLALDSQEVKPTLVEDEEFSSRLLQDKEDHRRLRLVLDEYEETIRLDDVDGFGDTLKLDAEDDEWQKGEVTLRLEVEEDEETLKLDDTEAAATLNFEENEEIPEYGETLQLDDDETTLGLDELPHKFSPSSQGAHYVNGGKSNNVNEDEQNSSDVLEPGDTQILTQVEDEIRSQCEGRKTAAVTVMSCDAHEQLSVEPDGGPGNKHDEGPNGCAGSTLNHSTPCSIGPPLKRINLASVRVASLRKAAATAIARLASSPIGCERDEQVGRTDEAASPCLTGMHKGDEHELERCQKVRKLLFENVTQQNHGVLSGKLDIGQDKEEQARAGEFFVSRSDMHYLNSQEPGEESQARALDVVDKFLWMHGGLSQEPCLISVGEKDQESSRTGTRIFSKDLLHVAEEKAADIPMNVFDWTDSQHNNTEAATLLKKKHSSSKASRHGEEIRHAEEVCQKEVANMSSRSEVWGDLSDNIPQERRVGEEENEIGINTQMAVEAIHMMSREDVEGGREQEDVLVQQKARKGTKTTKKSSNPKARQRMDAVVTDGPRTCAHSSRAGAKEKEKEKKAEECRATRRRTSESAVAGNASRKRKQHDVAIADRSARKQRRHITHHVLFSHGLLGNVVKQQQKLLLKLGGEVATDVAHCTHFIADRFMRSINMVEAMAAGKPVVTMSWLECSAAAGCFLNESKYILGDVRKEKELGFSMCSTLAAARHKPLLQGIKVGVTPSTRPPKEAMLSIVKAAGGKATGPKGKDIDFVVSCEEDHKICRPLINRGIKVYSPELLLHGIVTYKLDLSRFRLFESSCREGSVSSG